ncbi:patatin-like protein 2 [Salvia splendens]|uniref:patatin-like protein 2 n=1 Tax=Salvia splendens TaxID=180675 RepID=UPI001C255FB6|nr:patatin-like protein 2 [Salvia splendens]
MMGMLTAPDANNRPIYAAKDIAPFYVQHGPKIFPQSGLLGSMDVLVGPKYNGKYLQELIREILGQTRLHHTLTNVVVPSFDIKLMQPTIFSSYEVSRNLSLCCFYNLKDLVEIGECLLHSPFSRVNLQRGNSESVVGGGTNRDVLIKFAKMLSYEKKFP